MQNWFQLEKNEIVALKLDFLYVYLTVVNSWSKGCNFESELELWSRDSKSECVKYLNCNLRGSKSESRDSNLRGQDFKGEESWLTWI